VQHFVLLKLPDGSWKVFMFCFCLFLTTRLFSQMDERHPSKVYHRFYARLELVKLRHFVYPSPNFYGSHKVQNLGSVDML